MKSRQSSDEKFQCAQLKQDLKKKYHSVFQFCIVNKLDYDQLTRMLAGRSKYWPELAEQIRTILNNPESTQMDQHRELISIIENLHGNLETFRKHHHLPKSTTRMLTDNINYKSKFYFRVGMLVYRDAFTRLKAGEFKI